jgi:MYXO-CTERM domain-containing protein
VTAFARGATITVTIDEKIFHPGHYRIALAVGDRSELPAEPVVTPASTPCGSVDVQDPPVFPVLADGIFEHTDAFSAPQTFQVTLPADVTCTKCTLQVIEFMSDHPLNDPGGCFYHHCADISIGAAAMPDAGGGTGGQSPSEGPSSGGCGCSMPGSSTPAFAGLGSLLALAMLLRRRP